MRLEKGVPPGASSWTAEHDRSSVWQCYYIADFPGILLLPNTLGAFHLVHPLQCGWGVSYIRDTCVIISNPHQLLSSDESLHPSAAVTAVVVCSMCVWLRGFQLVRWCNTFMTRCATLCNIYIQIKTLSFWGHRYSRCDGRSSSHRYSRCDGRSSSHRHSRYEHWPFVTTHRRGSCQMQFTNLWWVTSLACPLEQTSERERFEGIESTVDIWPHAEHRWPIRPQQIVQGLVLADRMKRFWSKDLPWGAARRTMTPTQQMLLLKGKRIQNGWMPTGKTSPENIKCKIEITGCKHEIWKKMSKGRILTHYDPLCPTVYLMTEMLCRWPHTLNTNVTGF